MAIFRARDYHLIKYFIRPHINQCIDHYSFGHLIVLPAFHGCNTVNRNGTRKLINYKKGEQSLVPTGKPYWRKTKDKCKIQRIYFTQNMSQYGTRYLLKTKSKLIYICKLKKYVDNWFYENGNYKLFCR